MFWYLPPLKTCKLVPISLKDVRLGSTQFVPKSPCGIRIQNVFVPWYNTNLCTSPGTFFKSPTRSEAGKNLWRPSAATRLVSAERRLPLVADEPAEAGKELPAAAGKELLCPGLRSWWQGTTGSTAGRRWWSRKRQRGRQQQRVG